jgi:hypothetical protein
VLNFKIVTSVLVLTIVGSLSARAETTRGIESFERDLYPVMRKYCSQCHSSEAVSPHGPDHSDKDIKVAFPTFKSLVDFQTPMNSRMIKRIHNAHYCRDYNTWCGMESEIQNELEPAILKWIGDNPDEEEMPASTSEFIVPSTDKFDAVWEITGASDAKLQLHLSFEKISDGNYLVVSNAMSGETGTFAVAKPLLEINGKLSALQTGFETVSFIPLMRGQPLRRRSPRFLSCSRSRKSLFSLAINSLGI